MLKWSNITPYFMRKEAKAIKAVSKYQFRINVELNQLINEKIYALFTVRHIKLHVLGTQSFGPRSLCPLYLWSRSHREPTSPVSALTARWQLASIPGGPCEPGGGTPCTEVYMYVPRKCPCFWPFFSLCAPIKPDNSLFHRRGNFPMKTFRPGLPYTYRN